MWRSASWTPRSRNHCMAWIHGHHTVFYGQTAHQVRTRVYNFYLCPITEILYVSHVSLVLRVGMTRWVCCLLWWSEKTRWRTGSCWSATATPPSERPCTSLRSDSLSLNTFRLQKMCDPLLNRPDLKDLLKNVLYLIIRVKLFINSFIKPLNTFFIKTYLMCSSAKLLHNAVFLLWQKS